MIEIHCSDLDRILSCPASAVAPEVRIETDHEIARLGSAVHEFMARYIGHDVQLWSLWEKYDCDETDFRIMCAIGKKLWGQIADELEGVEVEQKLSRLIYFDITDVGTSNGVRLVGTCDVCATIDGEPIVLDWKAGYVERRHTEQVTGYLSLQLARDKFAEVPDSMRGGIVLMRDQIFDIKQFDNPKAAVEQQGLAILEAVEHPDKFNPDPENCLYCPRRYECPARKLLLQSAATALVPADGDKFLPDKSLVALYPKAKMLQAYLKDYDAALRGLVREQGPQSLGDGRELAFTTEDRDTISYTKASETLWGCGFDMDKILTVGKTALMKEVADSVKKNKGKEKEAFMARLREAGAVTVKQIEVFGVRKEQK